MRLVDTHCHLDFPDYDNDLDMVIERAHSSGVERVIVPGTSISTSKRAVGIASKYPHVFAACGVHPHEADKAGPDAVASLRNLCTTNDKVVAVGEIGLDYYRKLSGIANQKDLLRRCLALSVELDLPVILHNRDAAEDLLEILGAIYPYALRGVVHCFSAHEVMLKRILAMDLYISFTGSITFDKTGHIRDLIKLVPPEKLLLETDSPYMSPEPVRGTRNEPANVRHLLGVYADIYGLTAEDVARITTHNANQLFKLGLEEKSRIAYPIRHALYLNITNRCTNRCSFCTREISNYVKGHNLRLDVEPSAEEVIREMGAMEGYDEAVFCGFGEPTLRLDVVKKAAAFAKQKGKRTRMVTNGEGDLINGRRIAEEIKGLIDIVSVSLNSPDADSYQHICNSVFGCQAFNAVVSFIKTCRGAGVGVEVTSLDCIGEEKVERCRLIAEDLGASFRLRHINAVG